MKYLIQRFKTTNGYHQHKGRSQQIEKILLVPSKLGQTHYGYLTITHFPECFFSIYSSEIVYTCLRTCGMNRHVRT